eukprot:GHVU01154317.1.p3 GENE.GHVU01154317.1~~GHVU01154317.1.p3  ORF type:complete len:130 (-),score=19.60 GHVU01154317.1:104-493(-)
MPPCIIHGQLKQVRKDNQLDGPPGATYAVSDSGWVDADIFLSWAKDFVRFSGASPTTPKVLVMDNLEAHCDIRTLDYFAGVGVHVVGLPSHTSHVLQPVDVTVFGPMKDAYKLQVSGLEDTGTGFKTID